MTCSKNVSNPSPECSDNTDAFIVEKHTKLHKEKVCFQNYFYILCFCIATPGAVVLHRLSMNTMTIMVNL